MAQLSDQVFQKSFRRADVVGLLVRAEYYETDEDAKQEVAGEAELIIAKQRNGPIGDVPLVFLKEFTRFENLTRN